MATLHLAGSAFLIAPWLLTTMVTAQCALQWQTGQSVPGLANSSSVFAMSRWDPDGAGPLGTRLVFTAHFTAAGNVAAQNIAAYDPASGVWSTFGSGISGTLGPVIGEANGGLVVGGSFSNAGGTNAANIARWNGTAWQPLGSGTNGPVNALAALPNGDLVAGGTFTTVGGQAIANLARWDGTQWWPLDNPNGGVTTLGVLPNGDLVVAGNFTQIAGQPMGHIVRWDGATWQSMNSGIWTGLYALTVGPNGELLAAGGVSNGVMVAIWTGSVWQPLAYPNGHVYDLGFDGQGNLHVAGSFSSLGGTTCNGLVRRVGAQWQAIPAAGVTILNQVECWPNGDVFVGGHIASIGGTWATGVARWDGSAWHALASGSIGGMALALHERVNGDVVLGGAFMMIDGVTARSIASWNGTTWQALGTGWEGHVRAITEHQGDLVVGGRDASAFPNYRHIARWDGAQWHSLGVGVDNTVLAMLRLANGDLLVGGMFWTAGGLATPGLARWDGTAWYAFAPGLWSSVGNNGAIIRCMAELPNGDVVVGGSFRLQVGSTWSDGIARWDGSAWQAYGPGLEPGVTAIAILPNGELIAGGSFTASGTTPLQYVARWDGTQWTAMGSGLNNYVTSLCTLPDGSVAVGGYFTTNGAQYAPRLMRWSPTGGWNWFGGSLNEVVATVLQRRNGDLLVGGGFTTAGGQVAMMRTSLQPPCRATAATLPHGCTTAPSPRPLVVESLPWTGGTFRARASGLTPGSFVLTTFGFTMAPTPLSSLVGFGAAGCELHTTVVSLSGAPTNDGSFTTTLPVPNSAGLAGVSFRHQVFELTAGPNGTLGELRSNDALELVVGRF
jgi:hypothetical protein